MKITMLGSGAWEGIPAPFCGCKVCTLATDPEGSVNSRNRPQLLIENAGESFLLEASPDLRSQSSKFGLKPIRDFVISHWHPDHMAGLRELHAYGKYTVNGLNVYCSSGTRRVLETEEYSYLPLNIQTVKALTPFEMIGIKITPLPLYHMRDQDDALPEDQLENTFGYLLEHDSKRVAYLADYYRIPEITWQKLKGVDALICDGTYMLTDDYKSYKPNHMHGQEVFDSAEKAGAKQVYYHSISHLTHKLHDELEEQLPSGHMLGYDGLVIDFSLK